LLEACQQKGALMAFRNFSVFLMLYLLWTSGCRKGCREEALNQKDDDALNKTATAEIIGDFPGLDLTALSPKEQSSIKQFFNEEPCPCDCQKSFAQCLIMKKGCPQAQLLATWTIAQIRAFAPVNLLFQAVSEDISNGFLQKPISLALENAHHKGNRNARFTIIEFADFECRASKVAFKEIADFMAAHPNDVQLYFIHLPLHNHPHAEKAALAAEAAARHGKFWQMHDLLYSFTGQLDENALIALAGSILDENEMKEFKKDLSDEDIIERLQNDKNQLVKDLALIGTPSIFFNGRPYHLSLAKDGLELRLAMERARSQINCMEP
jgi:hypothetical protein